VLETDARQLLLEALRPPPEFDLDRAIGTTFSLDVDALLFVPLAFTLFQVQDTDGVLAKDPLALIEALRRYAGKTSIFCQAGQIGVPPSGQPLLAHLEDVVVPVTAPIAGGLFHPKVWILRFVPLNQSAEIRYRLLVMSRNLTMSNAWDIMISLDGLLTNRSRAIARNHPLGDFVAALPAMARQVPERIRSDVDLIADEIRRVRFEPPTGVDDIAFWALGLTRQRVNPFEGRMDRKLVVSPFIGPQWLSAFLGKSAGNVVVSREEELRKIAPDLLASIGDCRYVGVPDPEPQIEGDTAAESPSAEMAGLHAKLYIGDTGWTTRAWLGSANATDGAFHANVEFMVELRGKRSVMGVDAMVGSETKGVGFGQLLRKFVPGPDQGEADPDDELRRAAEELRVRVGRMRLGAKVTASGDDDALFNLGACVRNGKWAPSVVVQVG